MPVPFDEARNREATIEVDYAGGGAYQCLDLVGRAHGDDAVAAHGDRLGLGHGGVDRHDSSVDEHQVCRHSGVLGATDEDR